MYTYLSNKQEESSIGHYIKFYDVKSQINDIVRKIYDITPWKWSQNWHFKDCVTSALHQEGEKISS